MSSTPKKKQTKARTVSGSGLQVWGERRTEPDWDRFISALLVLAVRRVAEQDEEKHD
jgi:hypothetical protein